MHIVKYAIVLAILALTGCKTASINLKYSGVIPSTLIQQKAPANAPPKKDFPVVALAVPPVQTPEKRKNGSNGTTEVYYISVVTTEQISTCLSVKVNIKGVFEKDTSGNRSPGNSSQQNTGTKSVSATVSEDARMCGGTLIVMSGEVPVDDTSLIMDYKTKSISLHVNIPVHMKNSSENNDVLIAINSTQIATGSLAGGNITTSQATESDSNFDSKSESKFEGTNIIIIDGGIWVNNLAVDGVTHARISKLLSNYDNNGVRPADPFVPTQYDNGMG